MEPELLFPAEPAAVEPSTVDVIRDAALRSLAARGTAATSLRMIAEAAGVSIGLVQHHFGTKAGLITAVHDHVLRAIGTTVASPMVPPADPLDEIGQRVISIIAEHPDVVDYLGHAFVDDGGDAIGAIIFDGLVAITAARWDKLAQHDLTRLGLDRTWAALNPLILVIGTLVLRTHIEGHLPEPFIAPAQLRRWDDAVTALLRAGQLRDNQTRSMFD